MLDVLAPQLSEDFLNGKIDQSVLAGRPLKHNIKIYVIKHFFYILMIRFVIFTLKLWSCLSASSTTTTSLHLCNIKQSVYLVRRLADARAPKAGHLRLHSSLSPFQTLYGMIVANTGVDISKALI